MYCITDHILLKEGLNAEIGKVHFGDVCRPHRASIFSLRKIQMHEIVRHRKLQSIVCCF